MKKNLFLLVVACFSMFSTNALAQEKNEVQDVDFSSYGLYYAADFEAPGEGSIMFLGQAFPLGRLGFELGVGWTMSTFDTSDGVDGACVFKIGPAYVLPINRNFFVTTSLTFLCSAYSDDDDDWNFNPGASFAPRLGCKMGRVILTGGLDFMYMKGVDEIGTCFSVGLAMDL